MRKLFRTSMHSNRMRTAHLLPVSPSMHCAEGVVCFRGCLLPGVCLLWEGVCSWGGVCSGACLLSGVYPSMQWSRHLPWTDRHLWKHNLCKLRLLAVINTWQKCIPVGCIPPASMVISTGCLRGGVCVCPEGVCLASVCVQWRCLPRGCVCVQGVCPVCVCVSWGVSAQGEGVCPGSVSRECVQGCLPKGCTSSGPRGRHPQDPEADTPCPIACWDTHPLPIACLSTLLWTDRRLWKYYLAPNFVIILCNY